MRRLTNSGSASSNGFSTIAFVTGLGLVLTILYLIVTFPLVLHWGSAMLVWPSEAGRGDPPADAVHFLWALCWFPHALVDLGTNPFFTRLQNAPLGVSLTYTTLCPLYGLLALPVSGLFGPIGQYNFWIAFSIILTALGAGLLALELGGGRLGAILAAAILFYTPFHQSQLVGHLNIASTGWPTMAVYCFARLRRRGGWPNAAAAGLFSVATFYTSFYHAVFLAVFLSCYWTWEILAARGGWTRGPSASRHRIIIGLLAATWLVGLSIHPLIAYVVFFVVGVASLALGFVRRVTHRDLWLQLARHGACGALVLLLCAPLLLRLAREAESVESDPGAALSAKIYFSNTPLTLFLTPHGAQWLNRIGIFGHPPKPLEFEAGDEFACYPGTPTLLLLVIMPFVLRRRMRARGWVFLACASYLFSMGIFLRCPNIVHIYWLPFNGIVLPGFLFHLIPPLYQIRVFSRFAFYTDLALAVFLAVNLAPLMRRLGVGHRPTTRLLVAALLIGWILAERVFVPLVVTRMEIPRMDDRIAQAPPDTTLWFLPHREGAYMAVFSQINHHRPVVNALLSRGDPRIAQAGRDSVAWTYFTQGQAFDYAPGLLPREGGSTIRRELKARGVGFVVIIPHLLNPAARINLENVLQNEIGLKRLQEDSRFVIFGFE